MPDTDDGVTYKNMRVRTEAWELAKAAKGADESWSEYLLRCAERPSLRMSEAELRELIREEIENYEGER